MHSKILHIQKLGLDLSTSELATINAWRVKEFNSDVIWGPQTIDAFAKSKIFMIKSAGDDQILAFARLNPISIWMEAKEYKIWALGAVIAIQKKQGFGKLLLEDIKNFIDQQDKVLVGFCNRQISAFYQKCGMLVLSNGADRSRYSDDQGQLIKGKSDDLFFYPLQNTILNKLVAKPDLYFIHYVPRW